MSEQQAVVEETKVPAQQGTEVETRTDDTDNLDVLLAEFDQKTQRVEPSPPEPKVTVDPVISDRIRRIESRLLEEDIGEAVKQVFGDKKIPQRVAKGWLDQMARENPAIGQAFLNKDADPRTWNRFARSLSKEAEKDFSSEDPVDKDATADREAVAQAVRGASTKVAAEPAPNLGAMSGPQLRKHVMEKYGYDPG